MCLELQSLFINLHNTCDEPLKLQVHYKKNNIKPYLPIAVVLMTYLLLYIIRNPSLNDLSYFCYLMLMLLTSFVILILQFVIDNVNKTITTIQLAAATIATTVIKKQL